jgi:hypothetical protein
LSSEGEVGSSHSPGIINRCFGKKEEKGGKKEKRYDRYKNLILQQ